MTRRWRPGGVNSISIRLFSFPCAGALHHVGNRSEGHCPCLRSGNLTARERRRRREASLVPRTEREGSFLDRSFTGNEAHKD